MPMTATGPRSKAQEPPPGYLDGCTHFPDRFGKVEHRDICDDHDRACWAERRFLPACGYHARWAWRIMVRHARNWPWQLVAWPMAAAGFVALMTVGWLWWRGRPRWDVQR